jgi:soluble lytic murein transglycosylase
MLVSVAQPLLLGILWAPLAVATGGFGDLDIIAAMDALERGEDQHALELLDHYLQSPHDRQTSAEAHLLAARAALDVGEPRAAEQHLDKLEDSLVEIADIVLAYRAKALRAQGRWSDALAVWQKALAKYPDSPFGAAARYGIADAYFAASRWPEAKAAYESAVRAAPSSDREPWARLNLAVIAERQQRYTESAAGYRYLAYYRLGSSVSDVARARFEALIAAKRAVPPNVWQLLGRVDVLITSRFLDEAESALQAAHAAATTAGMRAACSFRDAKLRYRRRDFDAAIAILTTLAKGASGRDRLEYEQWLARTYSTAGRFDEAIAAYLRIADRELKRRDGREALFKAAWLGYNGGRYDTALKIFGQFIERYPRDSSVDEALWYVAWNTYRMGDLPTALGTLARLRRDFPKSALVQRTFYWEGRLQVAMGAVAPARDAYARAVDLEPLSYYGVLAAQRLSQLASDLKPLSVNGNAVMLASLSDEALAPPPGVAAESLEPARDELPEQVALHALTPANLPWGASVFDWQSAAGRRALMLVRVGMRDLAADVVAHLPALGGHEAAEVSYARARMLYGLGDFNVAYRIASIAFGDDVRGSPKGEARNYYHLAYPDAYAPMVSAAAREFKLSPLLILSIMRQESAFDDRARSWASAHGLMQIIPPTADRIAAALQVTDYTPDSLTDPATSIRFGAWYLGQLVAKFNGNLALAIASYNAGPEAVAGWVTDSAKRPLDEFIEEIPYRETRHYVRRVLGNLAVYGTLYAGRALELPESVPAAVRNNINF